MLTLTDAEVGKTIASDGALESIVMTAPPSIYDNDYFCLTDDDRALINVHISTTAISTGSNLLSGGFVPFKNLILKSIPTGSSFDIKFAPPPVPLTLSSLSPNTVVSGDPDIVLSCIGTGFTAKTVIQFGTYDEPTTLVSDTEVTTIVKPSLFAPAVVPVLVKNGTVLSDPLDFTFTEPAKRSK